MSSEGRGRKEFSISRQRNNYKVILALPERAADFFRHAHHLEREIVDQDFLAERVGVGKEFIHQVVPDEAHHGLMLVVGFSDVPPAFNLLAADVDHRRCDAGDVLIVKGMALIASGVVVAP